MGMRRARTLIGPHEVQLPTSSTLLPSRPSSAFLIASTSLSAFPSLGKPARSVNHTHLAVVHTKATLARCLMRLALKPAFASLELCSSSATVGISFLQCQLFLAILQAKGNSNQDATKQTQEQIASLACLWPASEMLLLPRQAVLPQACSHFFYSRSNCRSLAAVARERGDDCHWPLLALGHSALVPLVARPIQKLTDAGKG
jgi:hypothetical protein